MKSHRDEITQRYLLLYKLDARRLVERIKDHLHDAIEVFALRRSREHFAGLFYSRYDRASLRDLAYCSTETIVALDQFHGIASEMRWYVGHTEDMPGTVDTNLQAMLRRLEKLHTTLELYLDAESSSEEAPQVEWGPKPWAEEEIRALENTPEEAPSLGGGEDA